MPVPSPDITLMRVEAARYALLRRMAAAMRHQLVMHLQPIGMVSEVLSRRLRAPQPDLGQLGDGVAKINGYSKVAVQACVDLITWMSPDAGATKPLDEAVLEIHDLLRSNFSFRGYTLRNEVEGLRQPVGQAALRMLLPGTLLALADSTPAPADLVMSATADDVQVLLDIRVQQQEGEVDVGGERTYRPIQWVEIEALADAEDVRLRRTEAGALLVFNVLE